MKKLISILLAALILASAALMLTGCSKDVISVSSVMKMDTSYNGTRVITVKYPLSADIDAIKDTIASDDPTLDLDGVTFTYKGVEEDGYRYELVFTFSDREEYEQQVAAVIGRTASSNLSSKSTALTRGVRMQESFGANDLIAWMSRANGSDSSTKDMEISYDVNTVTIGSDTYNTGVVIDINEISGTAVKSIWIDTMNDKEGRYTRTFEFAIPHDDYVAAKSSIEQYFRSITPSAAESADWRSDGTCQVYRVHFKNLKLNDLIKYSAMMLDTDSVSISYKDVDNTSTPLSEGLTYEESLDTFAFVGPDKGSPTLKYTYSLPPETNYGSGTVFEDGKWQTVGSWEKYKDKVEYKAELTAGSMQIRIPDGIQYLIDGIDFRLESLGSERFRRTTDFLYSKREGNDGVNYAVDFFTKKGAQATAREDADHLVCSVVCEGTTTELTAQLVSLFGSGNFMAYRKSSGAFSLATKSTFTDYINLDSILNASNENRPIRYFVSASGVENIDSVIIDGSEKIYTSADESFVTLSGAAGTFEYYGSLPITSHIIIYVIFGLVLLGATIFGAYLMINYRRPGLSAGAQRIVEAVGLSDNDGDAAALAALTQTTTFSIAELGILGRNKPYVDEINKDIEARIELDRLTERKNEIRRKELEEMERKVYGTDADADTETRPSSGPKPQTSAKTKPAPESRSPLDEVPELDISVLKAAVAKTADQPADDAAPEDSFDDAYDDGPAAPIPQPAEKPANPFALLDEDDDDDEI